MKTVFLPSLILVVVASVTGAVSAFHAGYPTCSAIVTCRGNHHAVAGGPLLRSPPFPRIAAAPPFASAATTRSTATTNARTSLQMATEKSNDEQVKDRIALGHTISSALFLAVTLAIIYLGLDGPLGMGLPLYAASGPYLAAGVSTVLSGAASAGRLGSATYKRLALFQTEFNLCGISTLLLAIGSTRPREQVFYLLSLASLLSVSPSLAGYKKGTPKLKTEIGDFIKGLFTCKNINAFVYLVGTWFVGTLKVIKLVEMANLVMKGDPAKTIVTRAIRFGRLALLTGVMFTLKDAADRDRLEGTTFIDLNFMSSLVLASMAFYVKTIRGAITPLVWASAGFSAFTALNGLTSLAKKSKK